MGDKNTAQPSDKMFSVYVNIICLGDNENQVRGVIEDVLDEHIEAENYTIVEIAELNDDERMEIESGVHDDEDDNPTEAILDDMEIGRDSLSLFEDDKSANEGV